jgi:hypothetical protein
MSSDSVRAGPLDGKESTRLVDSELEVVSSGCGYGKDCKSSSSLKKTHTDNRSNEWLDFAVKQ